MEKRVINIDATHCNTLDELYKEMSEKLFHEQNMIIKELLERIVELVDENNRLEEENKKITKEVQKYRDVIETF